MLTQGERGVLLNPIYQTRASAPSLSSAFGKMEGHLQVSGWPFALLQIVDYEYQPSDVPHSAHKLRSC